MPLVSRYVPSAVSLPRRKASVPMQAAGPGLSDAAMIPLPARREYPMPAGVAGTALTVNAMQKLIRQGSKSPEIREIAADLAMRYDTDQGKIGSIFRFVQDKMKYVRDPLHQELVAGAQYHLGTMGALGYARGDCDDHTVLLGSMLEAVGYPTRVTTARMKPGAGTDDHVYLEVHDRRNWIPLDASNKKREAGVLPPAKRIRRW